MSLLKRALGGAATAALVASLFATTAGVALANSSPMALNSASCVPTLCTQVAGTGTLTVSGATNTAGFASPTKLTISGAGATFVAASGFSLETSTVTGTSGEFYLAGEVAVPTSVADLHSDNVTVVGATAGTATITEWTWTGASGSPANVWLPDGNSWTLTFTAATTGYQVSAATSSVATYTDATCATTSSSADATSGTGEICITIENASSDPVGGASVSVTMVPYGLVNGAQTASGTTDLTTGVLKFPITGSGLAGVSTISTSVTYLGVTTALAPAAFTWTGTPNTLNLVAKKTSSAATVANADALQLQAVDGSSNVLPISSLAAYGGVVFHQSTDGALTIAPDSANAGLWNVTCASTTADQAVSVYVTTMNPALTSGTVTYYCNSDVTDTLVVTPTASSIPAGGSTTFTVTAKDASGHPVVDGTPISAVASAGAVIGSTGISTGKTTNGVATFTYLAINSNGPVTVTAVDTSAGVQGSASIGVGQAAVVTAASNASALGVTKTGPFTTATKVASIGKYVTFKMAFGASAAGQHVNILVASKSASGVWSTFAVKTARIADASGNVYFYWRTSSAAWLSVRGSLSGTMTNAVQARWR